MTSALLLLTSCYDDYVRDYEIQSVGFANQTDVRSFIVGESMEISTGVGLGGVITNNEDRKVYFEVDNSLVNDATLSSFKNHTWSYISELYGNVNAISPLPADEYTLTPEGGRAGEVIIRKGDHLGRIAIKVDEDTFIADEGRLYPEFVIPLRITGVDGGLTLMESKTTTVIGVRYENMLFGDWWHGGEMSVTDPQGNVLENITYYTSAPQADNLVWTLTTVSPHSLTANAVGNALNGVEAQMKLTLNDDNTVTVEPVNGATYQVEPDGESTYNDARLLQERKIFLNYKYVNGDGNTCHAKDTLTFRNRIRDGVNEWQDENPENYE